MMWKQPTEIEIMLFPTLPWNWGRGTLPEENMYFIGNTFWHNSGKQLTSAGGLQKQM